MNLRISTQSLRIRISAEELDSLLGGKELYESLTMPGGGRFFFQVKPSEAPDLQFSLVKDGFVFRISFSELHAMKTCAPSKDLGLFRSFVTEGSDTLGLSFELDIKKLKKDVTHE